MALAEEIIDEELELEMLQANAEADKRVAEAEKMAAAVRFDAEIWKKQAIIQGRKRKQKLSSRSLITCSVPSSWHSRSHAKEVLPQPALQPRVTELGALSFKIVGSGKPSGAAVGSGSLQTQEREGAHCSKSVEPRPSVGAAMGYWLGIEPFRKPAHSQTELSNGSSFFMESGLGGVLDTEQLRAVKIKTEPKHKMRTGNTTVGRPRVKTELSMPGDQGRQQRCLPGFERVSPLPYGYAAEVDHAVWLRGHVTIWHDSGDTPGS